MQSLIRDRPTSVIAKLFKGYVARLNWIFNDLKSEPQLPQIVRDGINQELNSDLFSVPAICEKVALLAPPQREMVEAIIDELLKGEAIDVQLKEKVCS